jgi:hypothetical protein
VAAVRAQLARWIGRGDRADPGTPVARDWVACLCGTPQPAPWAAIWQRSRHGGAARTGNALLISAVELHAGMNSVTLRLPASALGAADRNSLTPLLAPLFAAEGAKLEDAADGWLASFDDPPEVRCTAPERSAGHELRACLPEGLGAPRLRRLLTECQMVLHQAAERLPTGTCGINGVWAWGEGAWNITGEPTSTEPENAALLPARLVSRDPLLIALSAVLAGRTLAPAADRDRFDLETRNLARALEGQTLPFDPVWQGSGKEIVLPELLAAAEAALSGGRLTRISVSWWPVEGGAAGWSIHRWSLWRLWRRPDSPWKIP